MGLKELAPPLSSPIPYMGRMGELAWMALE